MNHFKDKQFQKDVIIVAVGYYLHYNLSYRDVQEILYKRGIQVSQTTIYRWVQEYSKVLYRAIDSDGFTLDIWLRKKRDAQASYAFLKRLHKQFGQPRVVVTDKAPSMYGFCV